MTTRFVFHPYVPEQSLKLSHAADSTWEKQCRKLLRDNSAWKGKTELVDLAACDKRVPAQRFFCVVYLIKDTVYATTQLRSKSSADDDARFVFRHSWGHWTGGLSLDAQQGVITAISVVSSRLASGQRPVIAAAATVEKKQPAAAPAVVAVKPSAVPGGVSPRPSNTGHALCALTILASCASMDLTDCKTDSRWYRITRQQKKTQGRCGRPPHKEHGTYEFVMPPRSGNPATRPLPKLRCPNRLQDQHCQNDMCQKQLKSGDFNNPRLLGLQSRRRHACHNQQ